MRQRPSPLSPTSPQVLENYVAPWGRDTFLGTLPKSFMGNQEGERRKKSLPPYPIPIFPPPELAAGPPAPHTGSTICLLSAPAGSGSPRFASSLHLI